MKENAKKPGSENAAKAADVKNAAKLIDTTNAGRLNSPERSLTAPDEIVALARLYDSYGPLLKENQQEIFEAYVFDNLSLSEIAGEYEMTRQGVYDTINRSRKKLREYEDRLKVIERANAIEKGLAEIEEILGSGTTTIEEPDRTRVRDEIQKIRELL